MASWYASLYTGLFAQSGQVPRRPHDPEVFLWAGTTRTSGDCPQEIQAGGSGWVPELAELACAGEAIERGQARPLPQDRALEASYRDWPLKEPAVAPDRWVLFHPEQYTAPGFPFRPFTSDTHCRWVCCRQAITGEPRWAPEEMVTLFARAGSGHRLAPGLSTGLACGRTGDPVLLRGLQEVIERDALMGVWWGCYSLEEWGQEQVFSLLRSDVPPRVLRPNLRYRFYRIGTPFSRHAVIVTVEGEDREGFCFSAGSACRETRAVAWEKALLEAIHGRHFARHLKGQRSLPVTGPPTDFAEHAVFYSVYPERLKETVLHRPAVPGMDPAEGEHENLSDLVGRLGAEHPVLFRLLTPPGIAAEFRDWLVLRVLVPGLQPMHGDHRLAFLGGPLWAPRPASDWVSIPPHPFP
jgi:ribosomal protein S12 methylthiotransferase accessory factor